MVHGVDEHAWLFDVLFCKFFGLARHFYSAILAHLVLTHPPLTSTNMRDEDETNDTNVET